MQTLIKMHKVVIEDYYHMTKQWTKHELDGTNTPVVNVFFKP